MTHAPPASPDQSAGTGRRAGLFNRLSSLFESVWTGIVLMALLFVYCTVGSVLPSVRRSRIIEKTVLEWFTWWPFIVMASLLCVNIVVVTIRRVAANTLKAGVWISHAGVIIMSFGALVYFGFKTEGDTPVFRRRLTAAIDGASDAGTVMLPGNTFTTGSAGILYSCKIIDIDPDWRPPGKTGDTALRVMVQVTKTDYNRGKTTTFVRRVVNGYPELTADFFRPGDVIDNTPVVLLKSQEIVSARDITQKPLADDLKLTLADEPQPYFYVKDSYALYTRLHRNIVRDRQGLHWSQRPIKGLPHYNPHTPSADAVITADGNALTPSPLNIAVPVLDEEKGIDPLTDADIRVIGYLPYATMQETFRPKNPEDDHTSRYPVLTLRMLAGEKTVESFALIANDPTRYAALNGALVFIRVDTAAERDAFASGSGRWLEFVSSLTGTVFKAPVPPNAVHAQDASYLPIPGTDYSYRIRRVENRSSETGGPVVILDMKTSKKYFTRWVSPDEKRTFDTSYMLDHSRGMNIPFDSMLKTRLHEPPRIMFVGGSGDIGLTAIDFGGDRPVAKRIHAGDSIPFIGSHQLAVTEFIPDAVRELKPKIVPPQQRDPRAGWEYSMIDIAIDFDRDGTADVTRWLEFNMYALPDADYRYVIDGVPRFAYYPVRIPLPDGSEADVLFSRERFTLTHPVSLDDFEVETYVGGLTDSELSVRNWVSILAFSDGKGAVQKKRLSLNNPVRDGGLMFLQSIADQPRYNRKTGRMEGGRNFTGLGVFSRNGIYVMLFGAFVSVLGMVYAFYITPVIMRRKARISHDGGKDAGGNSPSTGDAGAIGDDNTVSGVAENAGS